MIDAGPLHTSDTGPRSRSKPRASSAVAIRVVSAWPTGIDAQGTLLMAMQTKPPSWSVAAMSRCRLADRTEAMSDFIASGDEALWLRLTTSSPPNWCSLKSLRTASSSDPWKPTIITAPTSSSSVSPPGPNCWAGEVAADGEGLGVTAVEEVAHDTASAATTINAILPPHHVGRADGGVIHMTLPPHHVGRPGGGVRQITFPPHHVGRDFGERYE